jgi:hypothetical protein
MSQGCTALLPEMDPATAHIFVVLPPAPHLPQLHPAHVVVAKRVVADDPLDVVIRERFWPSGSPVVGVQDRAV